SSRIHGPSQRISEARGPKYVSADLRQSFCLDPIVVHCGFRSVSTDSTMEIVNSTPMIEAIGLSKFYRDFAAIRDVNFSIPAGQVVAFLGPNGAGKSTTMKILTGYLAPSAGTARVAGLDVGRERTLE